MCLQGPPFSNFCAGKARQVPLLPRGPITSAYPWKPEALAQAAQGRAVVVVVYMARNGLAISERRAAHAALRTLRYTADMWQRAALLAQRLRGGGSTGAPLLSASAVTDAQRLRGGGSTGAPLLSASAVTDAEVRSWVEQSWPRYTAVQWRHEGSSVSATSCARTMLQLADGWGCTKGAPCVLVSDIMGRCDPKAALQEACTTTDTPPGPFAARRRGTDRIRAALDRARNLCPRRWRCALFSLHAASSRRRWC